MLDRYTLWRQGSVIRENDAFNLGLIDQVGSGKCAVVISHDCDLPHKNEPFVEVIVGEVVPSGKPDKQLVSARNPRRIHIKYEALDGSMLIVNLIQSDKKLINKERFSSEFLPDDNFSLRSEEKLALKQWLAGRYGRPAYPNEFENRLGKTVKKDSFEKYLATLIEPKSTFLLGVFFDLGEERDEELPKDEPYNLKVSLVYDSLEGGQQARIDAEEAAMLVKQAFYENFGKPEDAKEIALEDCTAVADIRMSLADLRKVDQWRLEYVSLRSDPPQEFLSLGSTTL